MTTLLQNYLNKRNSTRNLSDQEFDSIVDILAEELEQVSFIPNYTDPQLYKDWMDLKKWTTKDDYINSTNRIGMKLCEHFFPNFYDIADNKGNSFHSMWKKENLIKILEDQKNKVLNLEKELVKIKEEIEELAGEQKQEVRVLKDKMGTELHGYVTNNEEAMKQFMWVKLKAQGSTNIFDLLRRVLSSLH